MYDFCSDGFVERCYEPAFHELKLSFKNSGTDVDVESAVGYVSACGVPVYAWPHDFGPQVAQPLFGNGMCQPCVLEGLVDYFCYRLGVTFFHRPLVF